MSAAVDGPLVVAGFEAFGGRRHNRSWAVAQALAGERGLEAECLPVDFAALEYRVRALIARGPSALLLLGETPGRAVRVEQLALNVRHSRRPDNAGFAPQAEVLLGDGPVARSAAWDALALARRMRDVGANADPSFHAGTYACNAAYYLALAAAEVPVGFVHVPRRGRPFGPPLEEVVRACAVALDELRAAAHPGVGRHAGSAPVQTQ